MFILSWLLLQPQPSLIISTEKVTDMSEFFLSAHVAPSMHRVHADCFIIVINVVNNVVNLLWMLLFDVQFYMLVLNRFFLLWSAYRVVLFSAFALIQGGKNSASCAISLAEESLGPCLTINNHLLQRSSLQSNLSLSTAFYISLSRCLYRVVNLQCLFWLYLPAFPFPLPSQSSFTFAVTCYFLAGLSLDCCAPAVEVIRFPVLILSIAFSL